MKSKRICFLLLLINLLFLKNVAVELNEVGNFFVVSTSPPPSPQQDSMLNEKLSKVEEQLQFLTTKVDNLLEKQITYDDALKKSSKQIMELLEETREKQVQQDKTLVELSKKLEIYESAVDALRGQIEAMKQQIHCQVLSNKSVDTEEKNKQPIQVAKIKEDLSLPKDCKDVQHRNVTSGVYEIKPANAGKPFLVWCDMETRGGGWAYVLNRFDGSVDFSRNWSDYKQGFGDLRGELWLGLEHLYELTSSEPNELLVDLYGWLFPKKYAIYSHFEIGNEREGYKFKKWGTYSGDGGDSMDWSYDQNFSTIDNDQDTSPSNCAETYDGGWWYSNCYHGKLTGQYVNGLLHPTGKGIYWQTYGGGFTLKGAKMMIKPIKLK